MWELVGYPGQLRFDTSKPDGMPVKALDASKLRAMGWRPKTPFPSTLALTYDWFLQNGMGSTMQGLAAVCPKDADSS